MSASYTEITPQCELEVEDVTPCYEMEVEQTERSYEMEVEEAREIYRGGTMILPTGTFQTSTRSMQLLACLMNLIIVFKREMAWGFQAMILLTLTETRSNILAKEKKLRSCQILKSKIYSKNMYRRNYG